MWKVRELKDIPICAILDEHYDLVTTFESKEVANRYYLSVFDKNYYTELLELVNGHWGNVASSCVPSLAK